MRRGGRHDEEPNVRHGVNGAGGEGGQGDEGEHGGEGRKRGENILLIC